jgi:acyl-CoA synthetase (AMP-forming)/AMP-acid ligase II
MRDMLYKPSSDWQRAHTFRGVPFGTPGVLPWGSVLEPFSAVARRSPAAPFLTEVRGTLFGPTISYGEALTRVITRAQALNKLGIGPGTRVGLTPHNDIDSSITILSVLWSGAIATIADPADARARVVGSMQALGAVELADTMSDVERVESDARCQTPARPPVPSPSTPAIIVFTSGSTGAPRAVSQSHYGLLVNCTAVARLHNLGRASRLFACLPISHVNALLFTGFAAQMVGAHTWLADGFDPLAYLNALATSEAHVASVVPSILVSLVQSRRPPRLPSLGYFVSAAAPLSARTADDVLRHLGARIVQGYGLSEAGNFSCSMPVALDPDTYSRLMIDAGTVPVGPALVGNEVSVLRPSGARAESGETGEVVVRGHNVMIEYVGEPGETADTFRGGWLHTGDQGAWIDDPALESGALVITGRAKNIAKVGGATVGFEEVERVLMRLDEVMAVAACSLPDARYGEVLGVLVVTVETGRLDEDTVRSVIRAQLGQRHVPATVRFADKMPLLSNGKLARSQVRELLSEA